MKSEDYVVVGKVASTYGVQGWLKIVSYTEAPLDIADYLPWYLENNRTWEPAKDVQVQEHNKGLIAKFKGYDSPEKARLLTGKKIAVLREQLPILTEDEYYWSDLEGLTVIDQDGKTLGKVIYLLETGSNDVLVVKGEKEQAIPYIRGDVVLSIDLATKIMRVNWEEI